MIKVLVCGGRNYHNYDQLEDELNLIWRAYGDFEIIHGCAKGADSLADKYGIQHGLRIHRYPADWDKYGKAAGLIRNEQMLEDGKPDIVIAFPGGRGTAHMVRLAQNAEIGIEVIKINE